jgi:hypothetical protein
VLKFSLKSRVLYAFDKPIAASCDVRNELNKLRRANEVVRTIPHEYPYQPRQFPIGVWRITDIRPRTQPDREPFFIGTDAYREVEVWELDELGHYKRPSGVFVRDTDYGLHASIYKTTLGCIKIHEKADVYWLCSRIKEEMHKGETVWLEVLE